MLAFVFNVVNTFVNSDLFSYFAYIVLAFGILLCLIKIIRKVIFTDV